jgi:hypothetical protein
MDYQVRVFNQSMRTLVKELGKENEIMVRGNRIVKRGVRKGQENNTQAKKTDGTQS